MIKTMVKTSKLAFIAFEILALMVVFAMPLSIRGASCILLADIIVLIVIVQQIRARLEDVPLFFFNITYFLFVLGGATVTQLSEGSLGSYMTQDMQIVNIACAIALAGIAIIDTTYILIKDMDISFRFGKRDNKQNKINTPTLLQKQVVVVAFIVTSACKLMMAYETLSYSAGAGYIALYTRESSSLPAPIRYVGALFYFSLMLFLACNFEKRYTYIGYAVVGVIEAMILYAGDRGESVCGILILIVYTIQRTKRESQFLCHKKLVITALVIGIPLGIYLLQAIKYMRVGSEMTLSFGEGITDFFKSQGVSISILEHGVKLKEPIENLSGNHFIFGQLQGYLQQNVLIRTLFDIPYIKGNTVAAAISGTSYGSAMAYLRYPTSYLNGIGCGTCFLIELYHDFSWIGVVIGSFFLAILLLILRNMNVAGWIKYALCLNCMRVVFLLPRGAYFRWLTEIFSIPNLMLLGCILLLGYRTQKTIPEAEEI